jgi:hypothetical protein
MNIKFSLATLLLCSALAGCYAYSPTKPHYTKLAIVDKLPFVYEYDNGELKGWIDTDSICVTYAGDYVIYDLPYHYQKEVYDSIVFDGIKVNYFIYKKGQTHGSLYKTLQDTKGKRLPVDSIYKTEIDHESSELFRRFGHVPRKLVYNDKQELTLVKLYPKNEKMLDSVYLNFSKQYARLGHSLCRKTDAQYGSTLYKISMFMEMEKDTVPDAAYLNKFKLVTYEMIPLEVTNEKELTDFIERYKKQMAGKK